MRGAIPPLPNTPSWRGAQLKQKGQLYLYKLKSAYVNDIFVSVFHFLKIKSVMGAPLNILVYTNAEEPHYFLKAILRHVADFFQASNASR
jgi:hypothetical protein